MTGARLEQQWWMTRAACIGYDPRIWFPNDYPPGHYRDTARRIAIDICSRCPVLAECRAYACTHAEHGVWGGRDLDRRRT